MGMLSIDVRSGSREMARSEFAWICINICTGVSELLVAQQILARQANPLGVVTDGASAEQRPKMP